MKIIVKTSEGSLSFPSIRSVQDLPALPPPLRLPSQELEAFAQEYVRLESMKGPQVKIVGMNDWDFLKISPTDEHTHYLLNHGIGGCNVTLTFGEDRNGMRIAHLYHYEPERIGTNMHRIRSNQSDYPDGKNLISRAARIFTDALSERGGCILTTPETANQLFSTVSPVFEDETEIVPYDTYREVKLAGLIVKVPPKPKGPVEYRSWFTNGWEKL